MGQHYGNATLTNAAKSVKSFLLGKLLQQEMLGFQVFAENSHRQEKILSLLTKMKNLKILKYAL